MRRESKKSKFIGVRMTAAQEELLIKLREGGGYKSQTEVLLKGLEALADRSQLPNQGGLPLKAGPLPLTNPSREAQKQQEVMRKVITEVSKVDEIVDRYHNDESTLIQILLEIQREYNWLPKEALLWLNERLGVPLNRIYQIATFYKAFSLVPRGRHLVKVCTGTACHVRGAMTLLDRAAQILSIEPGENTSDLRFTLETVNCLGCCAMGPVMAIDGQYHQNPSVSELEKLFAKCQ